MNRYVCIHGHFYQPPRENPWLEEVERQTSARPFHDWNERVTAECYRPNAWSRILGPDGAIDRIVNNYAGISFNFGPTLLSWLERRAPEVYAAVLEGDRRGRERFGGHGSALAQPYNHMLLPLASERDKRTQVRWGIQDFEHRFGRRPEGMWLPETAVDLPTLSVLAEEGIGFTVLAPHQAARFRARGGRGEWTPAAPGGLPSTVPYRVELPQDRGITVLFYNGPVAHEVAFGGLLRDGRAFARRLGGAFDPTRPPDAPQISHIALDGETFGHHHRYGDMALAAALEELERRSDLRLTNYGEYLARHPPTEEVEILERTSWSCAHGIERWRSDCGCATGDHPRWNQRWRGPLREALDLLRDALLGPYEDSARGLLREPWVARDGYIEALLDPRLSSVDRFLAHHTTRALTPEETIRVLELLEMQRQLQQMYTSCGWFFDDLGGLEPLQNLQYASRALQLAQRLFGQSPYEAFVEKLKEACSNVVELGNGREIFERSIAPCAIELRNVCAHYALSSLFEEYPKEVTIYGFRVRTEDHLVRRAGTVLLSTGRAEVTSHRTRQSGTFTYGALYIGGHNLFGGVRPYQGDPAYSRTLRELTEAFERGDLAQTIRVVDQHFGEGTYTLRLLFRDEQGKIVAKMLESTSDGVEAAFRRIYESTAPVLRHLTASGSPAPPGLGEAAQFYLNSQLRRTFERPLVDLEEVTARLRELQAVGLSVDREVVGFGWTEAVQRALETFLHDRRDVGALRRTVRLIDVARQMGVDINLVEAQNLYYRLAQSDPWKDLRPEEMVATGSERRELFDQLGRSLGMRVR